MREPAAREATRQLVQQLYGLFNARHLDALLERAAPDIEWDWSRSIGPDNTVQRGPEAVRNFIQEAWRHWETIDMTPEEIIPAGDEEVVVMVRVRLRGRDGIEVEATGPHVQTWRDGRLARYRLFQERDDALAAVGL